MYRSTVEGVQEIPFNPQTNWKFIHAQFIHNRAAANDGSSVSSLHPLVLWFLWVPGPRFGLAEWADGCISVDLLVAGEAGFHGRRLLSEGRWHRARLLGPEGLVEPQGS